MDQPTARNRFPALPSSQRPRDPIAGEVVTLGIDGHVYRWPASSPQPPLPRGETVRRNAVGVWERCPVFEARHALMEPIR